MIQSTLVLVKPDGVKRGLVGEIISRFERVGLKIVRLKMKQADIKLAGTLTLPKAQKTLQHGMKAKINRRLLLLLSS